MRRLTAASLGLVLLAACRPVHGQESKAKGEAADHAAALTAAAPATAPTPAAAILPLERFGRGS